MSRIGNAIAIIGAGMGGYAQGQRMRQQQEADEEDRAFRRSQRTRMEAQQMRDDQLRQDVADAVAQPAPTPPVADAPPTNSTLADSAAGNREYGPSSASPAAPIAPPGPESSRSARMERVATAYDKAGQPDVAERYRALARQARDEGALELVDAIRGAAPSIDAVRGTKAGFVSHEIPAEALQTYNGVGKWRVAPGTMVQSFVSKNTYGDEVLDHRLVRPDGTVVLDSLNMAARFVGMDPSQRAAVLDRDAAARHTTEKDERDFRQRTANDDRNYGLRKQEVEDKGLLRAAQAEAAAARAAAAGKAPSPGPLWDDKADTFLRTRYTITDPTTGQTAVDGQGLQFAKQIALAQARRNGGDTTSALGYAFEVDQRIHQQAGSDPAKVAALRQQLLATLSAAPAPAPAAPAAQPRPTAQPSSPAQRSGTAPAPRAQAAAPAPAAPSAPAEPPEGPRLDAARQRAAAVYQALQRYGSRQRAADPQGFERTRQAYDQAKVELDAAERAWAAVAEQAMPPRRAARM